MAKTSRAAHVRLEIEQETLRSIAKLADWARKSGVIQPLARLLQGCAANEPFHVNAVLQFMVLPSALAVTREWVSAGSDWSELLDLADTVLATPHILEDFRPVPRSGPLAKTFQGKVRTSKIPLCLSSRQPPGEPALKLFVDQMRVWLVIEAYRRVKRNHRGHDKNIEFAADTLRKGCDRIESRHILGWLAELHCVPEDDEAFSRLLLDRIRKVQDEGTDEKKRFLNALARIAQGEDATVDSDQSHNVASPLRELFEFATYTAAPASDQLSAPGFAQVPLPVGTIPGIVDDGACENRVLSGRGLRVLSVEALQFLPWSWHVPAPFELAILWKSIGQWAESQQACLRALAFSAQIAILTSRSLKLAMSLPISDEPTDDWSIRIDGCTLHRSAPRPLGRRRALPEWAGMLRPVSDELAFDISELRPLIGEIPTGAKHLSDLWAQGSPHVSATSMFDRLCSSTENLRRISSSVLEYVLACSVYERTGDAVLAQFLSSGHRTAFGGNCSYRSWTTLFLNFACAQLPMKFKVLGPDGANAAGSELDPLDEQLSSLAARSAAELQQLAGIPSKWRQHHNAVVAYVLMGLFGATGGRPVRDPFECAADFDLQRMRVFIADKATQMHSGRLVPLPRKLVELLLQYRAHLRQLAGRLPPDAAEFANELLRLADGRSTSRLPHFFFLREDNHVRKHKDSLSWYSVSEASLGARGFLAGLPANLLRHRLSTRLFGLGVDPELVDALLGHADRGVLTHGDYSVRCWEKDMDDISPVLEHAYDKLGVRAELPLARCSDSIELVLGDPGQLLPHQVFGSVHREQRRKREQRKQKRAVFDLYREVVNRPRRNHDDSDENARETQIPVRAPWLVQPAEWAELARKVQTTTSGTPHPYGRWRFAALTRLLGMLAREHPLRLGPALRAEQEIRSPFRFAAIHCQAQLHALRDWFDAKPSHPQASKLRACQLLTLAVLDLVLYSRITWRPLLNDVLANRNYKLVKKRKRAYLEYHRTLDRDPGAPVARFRITLRCAVWLDRAAAARAVEAAGYAMRKHWSASWPTSTLGPPPSDTGALIRRVAQVVEQANFIELPGLIAGYRAGRVLCSALPHHAWLLDEDALTVQYEKGSAPAAEDRGTVHLPSAIASWKVPAAPRFGEVAAKVMFEEIREVLNTCETDRQMAKQVRTSRADWSGKIHKAVAEQRGFVSSAIWCLGMWIAHLAAHDGRVKTALDPSSIRRYLNAIEARFVALGSDFDLLRADSEEVAEFYQAILDHHRDIDLQYVCSRLREFHQFLNACYRPCTIDWGAIDSGHVLVHASPGLTGSPQYRNALQLLVPEVTGASHESLAAGFLLLLCHRFGTRFSDAAYLRSCDWRRVSNRSAEIYVLMVETYWRRRTKTPMTRRVVPQLEIFDAMEHQIIERFLGAFAVQRLRDPGFPLFAKDAAGNLFDVDRLARAVNDALSAAHGGERVTEHKARHGFGDRTGCALMLEHVQPRWKQNPAVELHKNVMRTLLGTDRPTRRTASAFSRAMGHSGPSVTFSCYFHRLGSWSDDWNEPMLDAVDRPQGVVVLNYLTDLDRCVTKAWTPAVAAAGEQAGRGSLESLSAYIGFLRTGCSSELAAQYSHIGARAARRLERTLELVSLRRAARYCVSDGRAPLECLARHLSETEWALVKQRCCNATVDPSTLTSGAPPSIAAAVRMVSEDAQLIMWTADHFAWTAAFVSTFELGSAEVGLVSAGLPGPEAQRWMAQSGLNRVFAVRQRPAMRVSRPPRTTVNGVRGRVMERYALIAGAERGVPRIRRNGLVLLWLLYAVAAREQSVHGRPAMVQSDKQAHDATRMPEK